MPHTCHLLIWPESPLERLVVVEMLVRRRMEPATAGTLSGSFAHASPADLDQVLQMLTLLGHAAREDTGYRALRQ